jgi:hypothetical protein
MIEKTFEELANCINDAPIIPTNLYIKFKPLIKQRIIYSSFTPPPKISQESTSLQV